MRKKHSSLYQNDVRGRSSSNNERVRLTSRSNLHIQKSPQHPNHPCHPSLLPFFRFLIKREKQRISTSQIIPSDEKEFIIKSFSQMEGESNVLIVEDLMGQEFLEGGISEVRGGCELAGRVLGEVVTREVWGRVILGMEKSQLTQGKYARWPLCERTITNHTEQSNIQKFQQKMPRTNTSVSPKHTKKYLTLYSTSSIHPSQPITQPSSNPNYRHSIFPHHPLTLTSLPPSPHHPRLPLMTQHCLTGSYLNKRNFSTDGGQFKFIKVTSHVIKWAKSEEKIDNPSCTQSYPLSEIRGIIYGKVSPTFMKQSNRALKEELCFSLVLKKRTMDFYCKDYQEVENWVCGLSEVVRANGANKREKGENGKNQGNQGKRVIAGYTPGKMMWRKMFARLREAFILPLEKHQRNSYYFQNAYSLILFKRNGYKLPQKA